MERFEVPKSGSVGYISKADIRPYEAPENSWSSAFNVRMDNYGVELAKGWLKTDELTSSGGGIHALEHNLNSTGTWWLLFGNTGIYAVDNDGEYDVTRASGPYNGTYPDDIWITDNFNGSIIATNGVDTPQMQQDNSLNSTTQFVDMTGWVANATAKVMVAYKNYIIAFNINDGGSYPNMVWWSDESTDGLIPTNWDYALADSRSGRTTLGTDSGAIVGAKKLRDSVFIYCENGTFRMDFQGGTFVFKFTEVFKNTGMFGPRCVEEYEGKHFLVTKNDIIVHDGQQQRSVATGKVQDEFFSNITTQQTNVIYTASHLEPDAKEVWIAFPSNPESGALDIVYAYNWHTDTWTKRPIPLCRHMRMVPIAKGVGEVPLGNTYRDICQIDVTATDCLDEDVATPDTNFTFDNYALFNDTYGGSVVVLGDVRLFGVGGPTV